MRIISQDSHDLLLEGRGNLETATWPKEGVCVPAADVLHPLWPLPSLDSV